MRQPSATWNRAQSIWETPTTCICGHSALLSGPFPRSGMTVAGRLFPLPVWVPRIGAGVSFFSPGPALLPTPVASDSHGPGVHGTGGDDLRTVVSALLPTPTARDHRSGQASEATLRRNARPLNEVIEHLLPTPKASDGAHGGPNQRGSRGDFALPGAVVDLHPGTGCGCGCHMWGEFAPAVHRWARILGRPAPPPTEPTGKNHAHRLSPAATEFLMGFGGGWVTGVGGLTRGQQIECLGNAVISRQAEYALGRLLAIHRRPNG